MQTMVPLSSMSVSHLFPCLLLLFPSVLYAGMQFRGKNVEKRVEFFDCDFSLDMLVDLTRQGLGQPNLNVTREHIYDNWVFCWDWYSKESPKRRAGMDHCINRFNTHAHVTRFRETTLSSRGTTIVDFPAIMARGTAWYAIHRDIELWCRAQHLVKERWMSSIKAIPRRQNMTEFNKTIARLPRRLLGPCVRETQQIHVPVSSNLSVVHTIVPCLMKTPEEDEVTHRRTLTQAAEQRRRHAFHLLSFEEVKHMRNEVYKGKNGTIEEPDIAAPAFFGMESRNPENGIFRGRWLTNPPKNTSPALTTWSSSAALTLLPDEVSFQSSTTTGIGLSEISTTAEADSLGSQELKEPPRILPTLSPITKATIGEPLYLLCAARARPPALLVWLFDSSTHLPRGVTTELTQPGERDVSDISESVLAVASMETGHFGRYECVANNTLGQTSVKFFVDSDGRTIEVNELLVKGHVGTVEGANYPVVKTPAPPRLTLQPDGQVKAGGVSVKLPPAETSPAAAEKANLVPGEGPDVPPTFVDEESTVTPVTLNQSVNLTCLARANPPARSYWVLGQRNSAAGTILNTTEERHYFMHGLSGSHTLAILTVDSVTKDLIDRIFECIFTNRALPAGVRQKQYLVEDTTGGAATARPPASTTDRGLAELQRRMKEELPHASVRKYVAEHNPFGVVSTTGRPDSSAADSADLVVSRSDAPRPITAGAWWHPAALPLLLAGEGMIALLRAVNR